eukprot:4809075-Amphidinium_carterae.1
MRESEDSGCDKCIVSRLMCLYTHLGPQSAHVVGAGSLPPGRVRSTSADSALPVPLSSSPTEETSSAA